MLGQFVCILVNNWVNRVWIEWLLWLFVGASGVRARDYDVCITHGSQLLDALDLQVCADNQEDDATECQRVNVGCQAIAAAVGDDILGENGPHRVVFPKEKQACEYLPDQALEVGSQDSEAKKHTKKHQEEDLQDEIQVHLEHRLG